MTADVFPAPGDLAERCRELQRWWRFGTLQDGARLRVLARERFDHFGDEAVRQAEQHTLREAAAFVVSMDARAAGKDAS